jgi:hypothetical protein
LKISIIGIDFNVKIYKKMKYIRKFNEGKNITEWFKGLFRKFGISYRWWVSYTTGFIMQDYYTGVNNNGW